MTASSGKGTRLDWNALKLRLQRVQEAQEMAGRADVLRLRRERILADRARAIAERRDSEGTEVESVHVVVFSLGLEKYALDTSYVLEVYPMKDYTPVPCTPPHVLGIINVRGKVFSVLDIKVFFGIRSQALTDLNKAILIRDGGQTFAVLADVVLGVQSLPVAEILPPPSTLTGIRERFLKGVTRDSLIVLDAGKLLSDESLIVRDFPGSNSSVKSAES